MADLIYYYPSKNGAPSMVGRFLFDSLIKKDVNFNLLVFLQDKKNNIKIKKKRGNVRLTSMKELLFLRNEVIHLSMSPLIYPNKKFFLYLLSIFKQSKLIVNYHGETRTEFKIKMANHDIRCLFDIPTYILTPLILKSADIVVLNSFVMKNLFEEKYNLNNIRVIPNGVDSFWFNPKIEKNDKIVIGEKFEQSINIFYHGRLAPEKGVEILLNGFSNTLKKCKARYKIRPIILYIAGDGPQKEYLKSLSLNLGIAENVIFLGKIPLEQLKVYLKSVDAAIYPSVYEPFSLAVLEALCSVNGPVMYSHTIGINDFVKRDGYTFHTFEPTVEGISNAIENIIEKNYDTNIHNEQKKFSRKYKWDNIVDEYVELYNQFYKTDFRIK